MFSFLVYLIGNTWLHRPILPTSTKIKFAVRLNLKVTPNMENKSVISCVANILSAWSLARLLSTTNYSDVLCHCLSLWKPVLPSTFLRTIPYYLSILQLGSQWGEICDLIPFGKTPITAIQNIYNCVNKQNRDNVPWSCNFFCFDGSPPRKMVSWQFAAMRKVYCGCIKTSNNLDFQVWVFWNLGWVLDIVASPF